MATGRRLLSTLASGALAVAAAGQSTAPVTTQAQVWELPDAARAALAQTQDFAFNFDQPGFYAVLDFVAHSPRSPGFAQSPIEVKDWRELLERPVDFRGWPVTVEGIVGHNKDPYTLPSHPQLGPVGQLELSRTDQPLTCTLILTGNVADIPLGAAVTVTGYFVMIRQYHGPSGRVQQAALLVAPGPTAISKLLPRPAETGGPDWRWITGALVVGLLITWVLLRRYAGRRPSIGVLRASRAAPLSLANDLAKWADQEPPESPTPPAENVAERAGNVAQPPSAESAKPHRNTDDH